METLHEALEIVQKHIEGDKSISKRKATKAIKIVRTRLSWMGIIGIQKRG